MPTRQKSSIFSERTLIPVSLLTTLVGVVFWTGTIAARLEAAERTITESTGRERAMYAEFAQLHSQVSGIDAKVTTILDLMQRPARK